jgi:hypothetical protein
MTFLGKWAEALNTQDEERCAHGTERGRCDKVGGACWHIESVSDCPVFSRSAIFTKQGKEENMELNVEDAIRAMLCGNTVYTDGGLRFWYDKYEKAFFKRRANDITHKVDHFKVDFRTEPLKQYWTRWEARAWANSEDSHGWFVRRDGGPEWHYPWQFDYSEGTIHYERARLLPDKSGIDVSSIQRFEKQEAET